MDIRTIKPSLTNFFKRLKQSIDVDRILIIGSYSENKARENSDVDVVVVSKDFGKIQEDKRFDILYTASSGIQPDIHPWPATPNQLKKASKFSLLGIARRRGVVFG